MVYKASVLRTESVLLESELIVEQLTPRTNLGMFVWFLRR